MPERFPPFELKNIIFDLDGVLVDSEELHTRAKDETLTHFGLRVSPHIYSQFKGRTDAMFFHELLQLNPSWKVNLQTLVDYKTEVFIRLYPQLRPITGASSFIQRARDQKLQLAVVTSATELSQKYAFQLLQLNDVFSIVVNATHVKNHKPDPEPYLMAIQLMGPSTQESSIVIEDSPSGIRSAKGAGLFVVGLTTTFSSTELGNAGADTIVNCYEELAQKLGWFNH